MKIHRTQIAAVLADRSLKGGNSRRLSQDMAAYFLSEGRVSELNSVLRDVQADWAEAGYVEVIANSARPLSATVKADIKSHVKRLYPNAKQVVVTESIDPAIVGGARLNLPDHQLDLSIEAKLHKFQQLTGAGKDQ